MELFNHKKKWRVNIKTDILFKPNTTPPHMKESLAYKTFGHRWNWPLHPYKFIKG
jgi:hypothetical protein